MTTQEILDLYMIKMYTGYIGPYFEAFFDSEVNLASFFEGYETSEEIDNFILQLQHFIEGDNPPREDGHDLGGRT